MAGQLRYELIGDASQFSSAAQEVMQGAQQIEGSIEALEANLASLTDGQLQYNEATGRFRDEAGQFVSAAESQARALQELNSEGVETTQQIREQIERLERLEAIYQEDARATADLSNQQQRLRTQLSEVGAASAQQNRDLSNLGQEFDEATVAVTDFSSRQERLQAELRATAAAQGQVQDSSVTMRSSVQASANNLGFEFVQAAQDARFGAAGVANQIPLMTEQFTQLQAKTGSASAAIRALGGSLFGTAGLIGIVTLGLPVLSNLVSSLFSTEDAAKAAGEGAGEANREFRGLLQTAKSLDQELLPAGERLESSINRLNSIDVSTSLTATDGGVAGLVEILEGNPQIFPERQAQALQSFAQSIEGDAFLQEALQDAGVAVEEILPLADQNIQQIADSAAGLRGQFMSARAAVRLSADELRSFADDPLEAIDQARVAADLLESELGQINQRIEEERDQPGLIESDTEAAEERLNALEDAAQRVIQSPQLDIDSEEFAFLRQRLREAGGELERLKEDTQETSDNAFEIAQALSDAEAETAGLRNRFDQLLGPQGVALAQAQRTQQAYERGLEALKNANRILARRQNGIQAQQVEAAPQNLEEAAVSAENLKQAMEDVNDSIEEFNRQTGESSENTEDAGDNIDNKINNQIARGIQLSAQLGATLVQSARQGGLSFQQAFSTILQTVGQVLALTGNPIAGAAVSGAGSFVGAFEEGGQVPRSGLALVGEAGPELVQLPRGSTVHSNSNTEAMVAPSQNSQVSVQVESSLQRIGPGELGVVLREVESYQQKHPAR